ncbi:MAG TPA: tetratricopeptide repeat protein [Kofleriaceae bacterium]
MIRLALIAALVSSVASANVWQQAIDTGSPDPKRDVYRTEMQTGDELAEQATAQAASRDAIRTLVQHAAQSYRNAATAEPTEAEPYYRLGLLIYSFYFECSTISAFNVSVLCNPDPSYVDRKHAQEVLDAWDAFEQRAPLDPRLGVMREDGSTLASDFDLLFKRAILHTRMADHANLEAAARDYESIVSRGDVIDENVLANLAETYMMLDRLDDAVEMYKRALRASLRTETVYGLAVALDRDERGLQARDLIVSQGEQAVQEFEKRVSSGFTFYVPAGEEYYYFGLIYESFGWTERAVEAWQKYIDSGAHPEFQARAKAHLAPLLANKHRNVLLESPWHDYFR